MCTYTYIYIFTEWHAETYEDTNSYHMYEDPLGFLNCLVPVPPQLYRSRRESTSCIIEVRILLYYTMQQTIVPVFSVVTRCAERNIGRERDSIPVFDTDVPSFYISFSSRINFAIADLFFLRTRAGLRAIHKVRECDCEDRGQMQRTIRSRFIFTRLEGEKCCRSMIGSQPIREPMLKFFILKTQ